VVAQSVWQLATDWTAKGSEFESRKEQEFSLLHVVLGPTKHFIRWVPEPLSLGIKWPERKAYISPSTSAEVKKTDLYLQSPIQILGEVLN
jgi:hypothetical protein